MGFVRFVLYTQFSLGLMGISRCLYKKSLYNIFSYILPRVKLEKVERITDQNY